MSLNVNYYSLGRNKQLNEIVMAGSHDAGVTSGDKNVKTQNLNIFQQAEAGVRIFDLRIAAQSLPDYTDFSDSGKDAELKAYHSEITRKKTEKINVLGLNEAKKVKTIKPVGGGFGMGLYEMLTDAKKFVTQYSTEFLILKFDHCFNWEAIAALCIKVLGDSTIYKGTGNLNTKTLEDLKAKVIVLFASDGMKELPSSKYPLGCGILGIKNLKKGGAYEGKYNGLQYLGKGGTGVFFTQRTSSKINENYKTQKKLMQKGFETNPQVMGMMYWTTTGVFKSISERDSIMWSDKNANKLLKLWSEGFGDSVKSRLPSHVDPSSYGSGWMLKAFMPNFVMIDFSDTFKCQIIYDFNTIATTRLIEFNRENNQFKKLSPKEKMLLNKII